MNNRNSRSIEEFSLTARICCNHQSDAGTRRTNICARQHTMDCCVIDASLYGRRLFPPERLTAARIIFDEKNCWSLRFLHYGAVTRYATAAVQYFSLSISFFFIRRDKKKKIIDRILGRSQGPPLFVLMPTFRYARFLSNSRTRQFVRGRSTSFLIFWSEKDFAVLYFPSL